MLKCAWPVKHIKSLQYVSLFFFSFFLYIYISLTAACGAEMNNLVEYEEGKDGELFWTNSQGQQESCKLRRCVSLRKMRRNSVAMACKKTVCRVRITNTGLVSVPSVLLTGCEDAVFPTIQLSHYISCFTNY